MKKMKIWIPALALVVALGTACNRGGSDSPLLEVEVTESNQEQLYNDIIASNALSSQEYQLLQDYLARAEVPAGQKLPAGMTVAQMIEAQRDFAGVEEEDSQAEAAEGEEAVPPAGDASGDQASASDQPPARSGGDRPARSESPPARQAAEQQVEPPPPVTATLPAGRSFEIRLEQSLSSEQSQAGEVFEASLAEDLEVDGQMLAPRGSRVTGRVTNAKPSGKVKGKAELSFTIDRIYVEEERYRIDTNTLAFQAEGSKKEDAKKIGIGAAAGAVIGAIAGGGKGAAIGTAIGAGAGTGAVLLTKGNKVEFPVEQKFSFKLQEDVVMNIQPR